MQIEFSFNNGMQAGTKTLIIADSGAYAKEEGVVTNDMAMLNKSNFPAQFKNMHRQLHILNIETPDSVFSANLDLKTATVKVASYMSNNIFSSQLKVISHDTFLGKRCEIKDLDGLKLWFWKESALKKK